MAPATKVPFALPQSLTQIALRAKVDAGVRLRDPLRVENAVRRRTATHEHRRPLVPSLERAARTGHADLKTEGCHGEGT